MIPPPSHAENRAAEGKQLGAFVRTFRADFTFLGSRSGRRRLPTAVPVVGILLVTALPLVAMLVGKAFVGGGGAILIGVAVLAAEGAALWFAGWLARRSRAPRQTGTVVHQFERGIVCAGDEPEALAWSAIVAIHASTSRSDMSGVYVYTSYHYRLVSDSRRQVLLFGSETEGSPAARTDIEALVRVVEQEVICRRLLPAATVAVDAGQMVEFDGLAVGRQGITVKSELIPWSQVTGVKVIDGNLNIYFAGRNRFARPAGDIANFAVLIELLHRFVPPQSTRSR